MSEHLGGVLAAIVGLTVLFIIAATNIRGQEAAIEAQQFATAKENAVDFSTMMARDFRNMGANYPMYDLEPDSVITAFDTSSTTKVFEFIGQAVRHASPVSIRYEWAEAGTVSIGDSTVSYYQIKRFVDGGMAGSSVGAVTDLSIRLLDADGADVVTADDTRQIEVALRIVSNLGSGRIVEWVRMNEVIHPQALSRYDSVTS